MNNKEKSLKSTKIEHAEIDILASISKLISSTNEDGKKFEEIFKLLSRLVPFESASLFIFDEEKEILKQVGKFNGGVDLVQNFSFGKGMGLSAFVAEEKRPILLPNLHDGPRFAEGTLKSFLSIPMIVHEKLVGVLNFGHSSAEKFDESHIEYLEIVAAQLAGIILQIMYTEKLEEKNKKLEEMNESLTNAQEKLIDAEKMATLGHVTAGINHEINNPLAVISGHLQLLEMESDSISKSVFSRLKIVMKEVDRISHILKNLQKVKKIVLANYTNDGVHMLDINKSIVS